MEENVIIFDFYYLYCLLYHNIASKIKEMLHLLFELVKNKKEKMEIKERGKFDWEKNERFHVEIIFAI